MKKTTTMYTSRFKTYFVKTNTIHFRGPFQLKLSRGEFFPLVFLCDVVPTATY